MRLVDLNCNFECNWLIELSDNKLANDNLTSKLVENRSFLNQSQLSCVSLVLACCWAVRFTVFDMEA